MLIFEIMQVAQYSENSMTACISWMPGSHIKGFNPHCVWDNNIHRKYVNIVLMLFTCAK